MAEMTTPRSPSPQAALDADGMHRGVGFLGLLWASEGSIIGSGWLFGALTAASIAGPSAIIAWVIASLIVTLALVHAELGGGEQGPNPSHLQNRSVGLRRWKQETHGRRRVG